LFAGHVATGAENGAQRAAVVGDHVLPETTANPFLQPPDDPDGGRPHVLPRYNESLEALRDEGYDRFLPGHGDAVDRPADRIDAILAAHEERTANVHALVDGPTTPAEVVDGLFGDLPATEVFAGMSEAVGHLDLLSERGDVESREHGGVIVYERTDV
jgi:glyoxylase-like metal-dependent hydrolase (beta-lactamase superfamily II)